VGKEYPIRRSLLHCFVEGTLGAPKWRRGIRELKRKSPDVRALIRKELLLALAKAKHGGEEGRRRQLNRSILSKEKAVSS